MSELLRVNEDELILLRVATEELVRVFSIDCQNGSRDTELASTYLEAKALLKKLENLGEKQ